MNDNEPQLPGINFDQHIMQIRTAVQQDENDIKRVYMSAFAESERTVVSELALNLLSEQAAAPVISLVAETAGTVIGHAAFSPIRIDGEDTFKGYILAPLAIMPAHQRNRAGSSLVESGIHILREMQVDAVFVYGDPAYYARFGFNADAAKPYIPPHRLQYPVGWQGLILGGRGDRKSPVTLVCVESLDDPILW